MSILDAHADDLTFAASNRVAPPLPAAEPGVFKGFAPGAASYFMRGMAESGRALSMAGAAVPVLADKLIGSDNQGESLADRYFRFHDETFGRAVDYWTPKPGEVGAAGQVVGSLAAGLTQFLANPALLIGTAQLSTAEDLVRQGVDAGAANVAGDVAGISTLAGIALPIFGKTLAGKVATGAAGNLATNIPEAAIKRAVVQASGAPAGVSEQFNPLDLRARTVDLLMGVAFGAKSHLDTRAAAKTQAFMEGSIPSQRTAIADAAAQAVESPLTATQRDAIMVMNAARHLDEAALPWRAGEAEHTAAVDNVRLAVNQISAGLAVDVPPPVLREAGFPALHDVPAVGSGVRDIGGVSGILRGSRFESGFAEIGDVPVRLNYDLPSLGATRIRNLTSAQVDAGMPRVSAIEFNPAYIKAQADLLGVPFEQELTGVIAHELAHARRAALGRDMTSEGGIATAERAAERFQDHARSELAQTITDATPKSAEPVAAPEMHSGPEPWDMPQAVERALPEPSAIADDLRSLGRGAGWAQEGGSIIRDTPREVGIGEGPIHMHGEVIGRTKWIPFEAWYAQMRSELGKGGLSKPQAIQDAIEKAIEGKPLKAAERRTVDWLRAEVQRMDDSLLTVLDDAPEVGRDARALGLGPADTADIALTARAAELDAQAVERAAIRFEEDDAAFMAEVRRIVGDEEATRIETAAASADDAGAGARPGGAQAPAAQGEAAAGKAVVPRFADDLRVPSGEFDSATGQPKTISANEYVAKAAAEAEHVKATAEGLMRTVATCILGGI